MENKLNGQDQADAQTWQAGDNEYAHLKPVLPAQPAEEIEQRTQ